MYDGELLPLYTNTNSQEAYLFGYNLQAYLKINEKWSTTHSCSYTFGKDDSEGVLLDHIPPFYGKSQIDLNSPKTKSKTSIIVHYNAWKRAEDYSPNGSDNPEEATVDGTPSWWTLNLNYSVPLNGKIRAQLNVDNILDVHYKTYSSGIGAPGRNIILSLAAGF
jgi:hemoglobin/transferrin/lactoferrin receptor protein